MKNCWLRLRRHKWGPQYLREIPLDPAKYPLTSKIWSHTVVISQDCQQCSWRDNYVLGRKQRCLTDR